MSAMHELSVARDLVDLISHELAGQGPVRVVSVRLRMGRLAGVVAQALRFAYDAATDGTQLDGSTLKIEEVSVGVFCARCDAERELNDVARLICPECGDPTPEVVRGRELEVTSIEIAELEPGRACRHLVSFRQTGEGDD
jgi:hydrogenase nickel incorporation protein HypA/HybF